MDKQEFLALLYLAYTSGINDTQEGISPFYNQYCEARAEELMQEFIESGDLTYEFPCDNKDKTDYVKLSMLALRTINQIDDYFEYGKHSERDKKVVMGYIDELTDKLSTTNESK